MNFYALVGHPHLIFLSATAACIYAELNGIDANWEVFA